MSDLLRFQTKGKLFCFSLLFSSVRVLWCFLLKTEGSESFAYGLLF